MCIAPVFAAVLSPVSPVAVCIVVVISVVMFSVTFFHILHRSRSFRPLLVVVHRVDVHVSHMCRSSRVVVHWDLGHIRDSSLPTSGPSAAAYHAPVSAHVLAEVVARVVDPQMQRPWEPRARSTLVFVCAPVRAVIQVFRLRMGPFIVCL